MHYLDDVSLPGVGDVTGVYWSPDREFLAVASVFRELNDPTRTVSEGRRLLNRVAVFRPSSRRPLAVLDDMRLPINDVAFHPTLSALAIGAGCYDGGYSFDGELHVWDWRSGRTIVIGPVPSVVRLRFADEEGIEAVVQPWNDRVPGSYELLDDPFGTFYRIRLDGVLSEESPRRIAEAIQRQIGGTPLDVSDAAGLPGFSPLISDRAAELRQTFSFGTIRRRPSIRDVALVGPEGVAVVHDDCLVEVIGRDGEARYALTGAGHGVQILRSRSLLVNVRRSEVGQQWWSPRTTLARLERGQLSELLALPGAYSFAIAQDGSVAGRAARRMNGEPGLPEPDVVIDPAGATRFLDLGAYDGRNHHARVDGAPFLVVVDGARSADRLKTGARFICRLTGSGEVERLWQLDGASDRHVFELSFAYIDDGHGPGLIFAGTYFDGSSPRAPKTGFISRRQMDGRELWRQATSASATSVKVTAGGLAVAAFIDSGFAVLEGDTGVVRSWRRYEPEGVPSIIISIDVDETSLAFGTIDGRVGVMRLSELDALPADFV